MHAIMSSSFISLVSPVHPPEDLSRPPLRRVRLRPHHVVDGLDDLGHLGDVDPTVTIHVIHPCGDKLKHELRMAGWQGGNSRVNTELIKLDSVDGN